MSRSTGRADSFKNWYPKVPMVRGRNRSGGWVGGKWVGDKWVQHPSRPVVSAPSSRRVRPFVAVVVLCPPVRPVVVVLCPSVASCPLRRRRPPRRRRRILYVRPVVRPVVVVRPLSVGPVIHPVARAVVVIRPVSVIGYFCG